MDPLGPFYAGVVAWADQFGPLADALPALLVLLGRAGLIALALGVLFYALPLWRARRRVEASRIREGKNGLQQILSRGRVALASRLLRLSLGPLLLGVVALLTPLPLRPSIWVYTLADLVVVLWTVWHAYLIVCEAGQTDHDAAAYIREHSSLLPDDES